MDDRSKSILLQVAFKEAARIEETNEAIETRTVQLFEILTSLHDKLGINPTMKGSSGGGGGGRSRSATTTQPVGETFILDGELYTDFRKTKAEPNSGLKPNYPDFKRESDRQGFWLYSPEGEPNEDTAPLVSAADGKEF